MQRSAEIVVVGGSVSGSFLAYLLGRTGKRVVVCEQAGFPRKKACGEGLSSIGHKYLVQAGLWSGALDSAATPFYGYNIISHAFGKLSLGSSKGPNPIGYSISRDFIDDFLLRTASELPDVELISQKVVEIMRDGAG